MSRNRLSKNHYNIGLKNYFDVNCYVKGFKNTKPKL